MASLGSKIALGSSLFLTTSCIAGVYWLKDLEFVARRGGIFYDENRAKRAGIRSTIGTNFLRYVIGLG
jgi:hypothetical protein